MKLKLRKDKLEFFFLFIYFTIKKLKITKYKKNELKLSQLLNLQNIRKMNIKLSHLLNFREFER